MNTLVHENRDRNRAQTEQVVVPSASVIEATESYTLEVEMPGVNKEGLEISVENNELTIIGRRSFPKVEGALLHHESRPENFRRTFELDPSIDADKISAKVDQGPCDFDSAEGGARQTAQDRCFATSSSLGRKGGETARSRPFDLFRFFSAWRIVEVEVITVT